ncbi:MAG: Asp-tRNA(Asn)/Glu-tRNA(Gln) amidotransferase subunit GatB [Deltaproteobacteria bacterium]|nr:Asp-tRNA(Asn)/Glu-tRNA(Gln) amidotransferase subunit GatB [Candidatus Zymogenaceae bacterium]
MNYQAVIGLEVHAQMLTDSKIFCGCSTKFGAEPNSSICPVCTAQPGVLPVLNKKVVEFGIKTALATHGEVCDGSWFARKNYFYPDLPKGYQISQYEHPLARGGHVEIETDGGKKKIGLTRIHMEEDAGKLLHDEHAPQSYVDLNRTGVPLLEIVSEPDINSPQEAGAYLKKLRSILRYLEVCDGNMEEGSFRCDANVSVRPAGAHELGTRTELKNMNSFRNVEKALEYEIKRQVQVLEDGGRVNQETRLWNDARDITESMRSKEEAHDYRYFPDPDLVALTVDHRWIEQIRQSLPELPDHKVERFVCDYGIPHYDAQVLCAEKEMADYFEAVVRENAPPKQASNWIMTELMRELKENRRDIADSPINPVDFAGLINLIEAGTISGKIAKTVFSEMAKTGKTAQEIVRSQGLTQISDPTRIEEVIRRVVGGFPKEAADFRAGKERLLGFFVGRVMKETQGKANPQLVNDLLQKVLSEP